MTTAVLIFTLLLITACNSFERSINKDPRYAKGINYESKKPIKPILTNYGDYTFVSGYSDTAATLGMYYLNKVIKIWTSTDGYYDSIMKADLNVDNIPDFIFENAFEDGSTLYALISKSNRDFYEKVITDDYGGSFCIERGDTTQYLQPLVFKDINNNGNNEVIINLVKLNNNLFAISCTDTFYIDR